VKSCGVVISILPAVLAVCGLCSVPAAVGDTIVLKEGQRLTGDILAEKETLVYLDIGIDVLTIPKEKILEYKYARDESGWTVEGVDVNDANLEPNEPHRPAGQLYRTADLKETTIEKCVDAFSEAVVITF
jgi:hypothetical protein